MITMLINWQVLAWKNRYPNKFDKTQEVFKHFAPIMEVSIVDNDRCEPHGARDYVRYVIISIVTILVGLANLPRNNGIHYLLITSELRASLIGINPGLLHGVVWRRQSNRLTLNGVNLAPIRE